jgi:hypothetical protein
MRILGGAVFAVVLFSVLVAPVVLRGGGGGSCARTLVYGGRTYTARDLGNAQVVQAIAVGVGVLSGCGASTENADVRSVVGLRPTEAVGLPTEASTLYVANGRCRGLTAAPLVRCLRG